jgi:hypothetical protein
LAFEPSGKAADNINAGDGREVPGSSLPSPAPAHAGFHEKSALFRTVRDLPIELRALHGRVDPAVLRWAAAKADQLNIGADLVIARSGAIDPDAMLEAYAIALGADIDRLDDAAEDATIDVAAILRDGILPAHTRQNQPYPTIALTSANIKDAYARAAGKEEREFRITSIERLRAYVTRCAAKTLAEEAAFGLHNQHPGFSAATVQFVRYRIAPLAALLAAALSFYFAPGPSRFVIEVMLAIIFLTWAGLRLFACFSPARPGTIDSISQRDLPIYTILVPLYREAVILPDLVAAISALNYPREKLDVKLILEPDDKATKAAVEAIRLDSGFEIIYAPLLGPRTKPKALRAAMPFVRGEYIVVYDAEDRPHPDQLRAAYARFLSGDAKLACVQAKLAIDNAYPSFLTAHFRAEYSGLFDVLLPALARLKLPLPLGGTSNHFRTSVLREVGAWDPHNVTEDADLGVRLARFGFTTGVVDSTTWEEAPARLGAWLPQRTRWMKGWLQTSA